MKNKIVSLFMGLGIICFVQQTNAGEFKERISKEFIIPKDVTKSTLFIYNVSGFIKVEGYKGNNVLLEIDKTITADDDKILETGKKEFRLAFDRKSDSIIAYIAEPFDSRPHRNMYYDNDREIEYDFNADFTVRVPFDINLHISTVNNGIISVNNVRGTLYVNNVNGEIKIDNAEGTTYAHTVNGNVTVSYLTNPPEESSYYTINGDIHVSYQPDLSADLQFKSIHGDFFTDFTDTKLLPATVEKIQEKKQRGIEYKLNTRTFVRFGIGGKTFRFETLNGNVYIKKQS